MPPQLALGLNAVLVFWLFRRDMRLRELPSQALWIPAVWLVMAGSRAVSLWLLAIGVNMGASNNLDGSPLDMVIFLGLIMAAVLVLVHRRFDWVSFVGSNKTLIVMYLFLALSALWSVIGFVSLKRALKDFGHVLVALVFLSEVDPLQAMRIVFVRVSYLLFPLSVVLIKYFPQIGRVPNRAHDNMFTGVTMDKNNLGVLVFVFGLILIVDLIEMRRRPEGYDKKDIWIRYGMLAIGVWLLLTCNSLTSMICLALGSFLLWGSGRLLRTQKPRRTLVRCMAAIACLAALELGFDASANISEWFGRDRTMSGRTFIWELVKQTHTDPIHGCGFYSFWTTKGAEEISDLFLGTLNSAHNGLLEMYLDGGCIGLALLVFLLLVWGWRSVQRMLAGTLRGRLTLTFWMLAIIHNFSETGYFRFWPLWFTLLLLMIECPPARQAVTEENLAASPSVAHPA